MPFGGKTYDRDRDGARLTGQLLRTWQVMQDGRERTLAMIAREASMLRADDGRDSEAAISARLRDFRKDKFGSHEVVSRNGGGGLWWYRLERRAEPEPAQPTPLQQIDLFANL